MDQVERDGSRSTTKRFAGKLKKMHGCLVTPGQQWVGMDWLGPFGWLDAQRRRHDWGGDGQDDEEVLSAWAGRALG